MKLCGSCSTAEGRVFVRRDAEQMATALAVEAGAGCRGVGRGHLAGEDCDKVDADDKEHNPAQEHGHAGHIRREAAHLKV